MVLDALQQRLNKYREAGTQARASGDERKARMHERIAKVGSWLCRFRPLSLLSCLCLSLFQDFLLSACYLKTVSPRAAASSSGFSLLVCGGRACLPAELSLPRGPSFLPMQQYQGAIRAHQAGRKVDFAELPVPPGE